jgi:hypothetical protein
MSKLFNFFELEMEGSAYVMIAGFLFVFLPVSCQKDSRKFRSARMGFGGSSFFSSTD